MASANGNNQILLEKMANKAPAPASNGGLKGLLENVNTKKRFEEILGKQAAGFMSSIISVANASKQLKDADPITVIAAAAKAAAMDLPIDPNLGFAYIVPYNNKGKMQAQFQLGYRGYIQLAMRTGQYKTINASEVYEGEIKSINRFTGEIEFGEKQSDVVIGYIAYLKLINGFEKYLYMTKEEVQAHGKTYSKSYSQENGRWKQDFHSMAIKTVLKRLLSKYGILSIQMQKMGDALTSDEGIINEGGEVEFYPDSIDIEGAVVNTETGEITER